MLSSLLRLPHQRLDLLHHQLTVAAIAMHGIRGPILLAQTAVLVLCLLRGRDESASVFLAGLPENVGKDPPEFITQMPGRNAKLLRAPKQRRVKLPDTRGNAGTAADRRRRRNVEER